LLTSCLLQTFAGFLLLSFFVAGWVIIPVLRPYVIGRMQNPYIQNLSEAFEDSREISNAVKQGLHTPDNESLEFQDAG